MIIWVLLDIFFPFFIHLKIIYINNIFYLNLFDKKLILFKFYIHKLKYEYWFYKRIMLNKLIHIKNKFDITDED